MNRIHLAARVVVDALESRRLLSGELDPTFGAGGRLVHDAPLIPTGLAVRADGKILFSGWGLSDAGSVVRLNADGTTDPSFGNQGLASSNQGTISTGLAVDAAGRIAVSGVFNQYDPKYGPNQATLAVYTPAGHLDTTFASGGTISTSAFGPEFLDTAVQADGKVIALGRKLVRYTAGGTLDTTFGGGDGVVDVSGRKVLVDADGKLLVLGYYALFRFNPDGTPDLAFDGDGVRPNVKGSDLALAPDGDILVAGNGPYLNYVSRFNADGSIDGAFGHDGSVVAPGNVLAVTARDIFVAGTASTTGNPPSTDAPIYALTSTGQPDTAFGVGGVVHATIPPYDMVARDGKLLTIGQADVVINGVAHESRPALVRYRIAPDTPPAPGQQPYAGTPFQLPGTLQLEDYDKGGEGIAFHDTDAVNQGAAYRAESADVQPIPEASGGGYALAFTRPGEWTEYTFNAAPGKAGSYDLTLRYAMPYAGGRFRLEIDGRAITYPDYLAPSASWQDYKTITYNTNIAPGTHVLRLSQYAANTAGFVANYDSLQFTRHRIPRPGSPWLAGQTIDAERYDEGSEGSTYHDTEPADLGGGNIYAGEGVDIERHTTPAGVYTYSNVSYTKAGEWLEYTVENPNATDLLTALDVRLASLRAGGRFHFDLDGKPVASFAVPATGSWQTYTTLSSAGNVLITPGTHVLRLTMDQNNAIGYVANFDSFTLTPVTTPVQTPYGGKPTLFLDDGGYLSFENFDDGGEGVSFHDTDAANLGGAYRNTPVDLQPTSYPGGTALAFTRAGEWTEYTLDVTTAGVYSGTIAYTSPRGGGRFHFELDGQPLTASLTLPATRDWTTNYQFGLPQLTLPAGRHVLRLAMDANDPTGYVGNFDEAILNRLRNAPFHATPFAPNQTIEAEDFDTGGYGVAYVDSDNANLGGAYRPDEGVDIEPTTDEGGGYNVGLARWGESLTYSVDTPTPGPYAIEARVASPFAGGQFHVDIDGKRAATFTTPATGGWQTYTTLTSPKTFVATPGRHALVLTFDRPNQSGFIANLNWLKLIT